MDRDSIEKKGACDSSKSKKGEEDNEKNEIIRIIKKIRSIKSQIDEVNTLVNCKKQQLEQRIRTNEEEEEDEEIQVGKKLAASVLFLNNKYNEMVSNYSDFSSKQESYLVSSVRQKELGIKSISNQGINQGMNDYQIRTSQNQKIVKEVVHRQSSEKMGKCEYASHKNDSRMNTDNNPYSSNKSIYTDILKNKTLMHNHSNLTKKNHVESKPDNINLMHNHRKNPIESKPDNMKCTSSSSSTTTTTAMSNRSNERLSSCSREISLNSMNKRMNDASETKSKNDRPIDSWRSQSKEMNSINNSFNTDNKQNVFQMQNYGSNSRNAQNINNQKEFPISLNSRKPQQQCEVTSNTRKSCGVQMSRLKSCHGKEEDINISSQCVKRAKSNETIPDPCSTLSNSGIHNNNDSCQQSLVECNLKQLQSQLSSNAVMKTLISKLSLNRFPLKQNKTILDHAPFIPTNMTHNNNPNIFDSNINQINPYLKDHTTIESFTYGKIQHTPFQAKVQNIMKEPKYSLVQNYIKE